MPEFSLRLLASAVPGEIDALLTACATGEEASGPVLAPVDDDTDIWASGVTYLRSREARMHESDTADVYDKVYEAERPELFFKGTGWRVRGMHAGIRVRRDATWNVPEPELALVANAAGQIIGYTAGNDVSSRDIEGANPLYLPQAKVYNGSCALGPGIVLGDAPAMASLPIRLTIKRQGAPVFDGDTGIHQMKRSLQELIDCLFFELDMPAGAVLLTGAGIVPGDDFTLATGDVVEIRVGDLLLSNPVVE
ncbi:MAG: fumarylacetoacetate hydrolase family protein [Pseudomonadota bacterium]